MGSEESGESHYRLVTLGGSGVGKSAILKRFLFGNYVDRHRPTVEELYCREFDILKRRFRQRYSQARPNANNIRRRYRMFELQGHLDVVRVTKMRGHTLTERLESPAVLEPQDPGLSKQGSALYAQNLHGGTQLKVTFLDTAGDMQFPAMRRLSIANGQAFLLVYSLDNEESFRIMKQCFQEIRDQKTDFQELPIMVVANKCDLPEDRHKVTKEEVNEWLFCELPKVKAKTLEVSAKDNTNIREIFRTFLQLAGIPTIPSEVTHHALRRRFSTHVNIGKHMSRFNSSLSPQKEQQAESSPESSSPQQSSSQKATKPRSRSLIRRTSKKSSKHKDKDNQNSGGCNDGDCHVS